MSYDYDILECDCALCSMKRRAEFAVVDTTYTDLIDMWHSEAVTSDNYKYFIRQCVIKGYIKIASGSVKKQ